MSSENEEIIRQAYQRAEDKDIEAFIGCFTDDGTFTDQSIGVTYRGIHIGDTVINYGTAFPDMHRELYHFYSTGNIVVVQLALQGTHRGPLKMPGERSRPPASAWTRRVPTCSSSSTARSSASTATPQGRSPSPSLGSSTISAPLTRSAHPTSTHGTHG